MILQPNCWCEWPWNDSPVRKGLVEALRDMRLAETQPQNFRAVVQLSKHVFQGQKAPGLLGNTWELNFSSSLPLSRFGWLVWSMYMWLLGSYHNHHPRSNPEDLWGDLWGHGFNLRTTFDVLGIVLTMPTLPEQLHNTCSAFCKVQGATTAKLPLFVWSVGELRLNFMVYHQCRFPLRICNF